MMRSGIADRGNKPLQGNWHWTSILRMALGFLFLVLGIAGLFLPVLQGLLFIAIGIALLADHIPVFARLRNWIYRRYPRVEHVVQRIRRRGKNKTRQ